MVYVISKDGQPLMPTERHGKVRRLLRDMKAKVVRRCPFTIQLLYDATTIIQEITLGVDAGSKTIGLSATTNKKVLFEAEVTLRNDIVDLLSTHREIRRARRHRKTRYRKPRFNNRKRKDGWLAPSVQQKMESHITVISKVHKILPIRRIVLEVASFDIQKIKNPDIQGKQYQQGEQLGFWNVREYVLFRDGHTCQCCKGKSKDKVLNVHHIESRKVGGDTPNNLITLCKTCHTKHHKGEIALPKKIRRGMKCNDASFMGIMRWVLYERLKNMYPDIKLTYGYITKCVRIRYDLTKTHYIDARCINGNPLVSTTGEVFSFKKIRCHNRQIHKMMICKGGIRRMNQAPYIVKGFRLYDRVIAKGKEWYIHSRRTKGSFILKTLLGDSLEIVPTKIRLLGTQRGFIVERRTA